jgi:hypothetical protein
MDIMIALDDDLIFGLTRKARNQQLSIDQLAIGILKEAVRETESVSEEEAARRIEATAAYPSQIRPATKDLAGSLSFAHPEVDFDLLPRAVQNLAEWARFRPSLTRFIPDEDAAENAATLQRALRRQGWQLETVDAFIAVFALRCDLVLLTADNDFVPVPKLKLENWLV